MTTEDILDQIKGGVVDAYIMDLLDRMDDGSEDLEVVMAVIEEHRPELRMRLKEKAVRNI